MERLLSSQRVDEIARGLVTCCAEFVGEADFFQPDALPLAMVEAHLFQEDAALSTAAAWVWGLAHHIYPTS